MIKIDGIKVTYNREYKVSNHTIVFRDSEDEESPSIYINFVKYKIYPDGIELLRANEEQLLLIKCCMPNDIIVEEFKRRVHESKARQMAKILDELQNGEEDVRFFSAEFTDADSRFKDEDILAYFSAQKLLIDTKMISYMTKGK